MGQVQATQPLVNLSAVQPQQPRHWEVGGGLPMRSRPCVLRPYSRCWAMPPPTAYYEAARARLAEGEAPPEAARGARMRNARALLGLEASPFDLGCADADTANL